MAVSPPCGSGAAGLSGLCDIDSKLREHGSRTSVDTSHDHRLDTPCGRGGGLVVTLWETCKGTRGSTQNTHSQFSGGQPGIDCTCCGHVCAAQTPCRLHLWPAVLLRSVRL